MVAPLGKISEFDDILDKLSDSLYTKRVPMITCPKTFCGCGMCITKSKDNVTAMFNRHTIDELGFEKVSQKSSNYLTDVTTKKVFHELDSATQNRV